MKIIFIVIEIALAIRKWMLVVSIWSKDRMLIWSTAFGIFESEVDDTHINTSAVLEWAVAFIFFFYVLTYIVDLLPAVRHHERMSHPGFAEMGMLDKVERVNGHTNGNNGYPNETDGYTNGTNGTNGYTNGIDGTNGYTNGTNGYTNGYTNGNTNGYTNGDGAARNF